MVPILYESNETQFASNGLGRLRDCISCIVTEERNGVYELDFEYPVDGHNFKEIKPGRVVGATHDDTNDIQPFDIVSYQKTIRGTVQFHCVHISYRTLKLITYGTNINSLDSALAMLGRAEPENPFTYEADFDSSNFMASGDGTPRPVRQFLGGVEGSILDTYGGELLFDKFAVKLLRARGEYKPVTVRYGLNLTEYNEDSDYLETYTSAVPYWHGADANGNDTVVIGDRVDSALTAYNGRNDCSALDLTDKFETIPTKAALQSMALTMMRSDASNMPSQSIEVKYIDLKNFGEYQTIANLIKCKLCDSINVVFPRYGMNARFKIVKTEYDVLQDRFESMELGKLSTTLAEALGIGSSSLQGGSGQAETADRIIEHGTSGGWYYEKYDSGLVKAWYDSGSTTTTCTTSNGNGWYRNADAYKISMSGLGLASVHYASVTANAGYAHLITSLTNVTASELQYYVGHLGSYSSRSSRIYAEVVGRWQ